MKLPSTKQTLIASSILALTATAGTYAYAFQLAATETQQPATQSNVTVTKPVEVVEPAPVAAPEPAQAPVAVKTPTSAPAVVEEPVAPVVPTAEEVRRGWLVQAGITDSYQAVDSVLKYSSWEPLHSANNQLGMCTHVSSMVRSVGLDPVSQLQYCDRFITAAFGSWEQAGLVLARRAQ